MPAIGDAPNKVASKRDDKSGATEENNRAAIARLQDTVVSYDKAERKLNEEKEESELSRRSWGKVIGVLFWGWMAWILIRGCIPD